MEFTYGSTNPGVEFTIAAGRAKLAGKTANTGGLKIYRAFGLGRMDLPAGTVEVAVRPGKFQGAVMNFRLLKLTPVGR